MCVWVLKHPFWVRLGRRRYFLGVFSVLRVYFSVGIFSVM